MIGTDLIALPDLGATRSSVKGVLLVMAALVSYGFAIHVARPLQQRNGALPVMWRALPIALVLTAPLGLPAVAAAQWSLGPWLPLVALGARGTAVAQVLAATAAGRLGAARASATVFITPVVALALGVVFLREHVAALSVLGCAVCLLGAWITPGAEVTGDAAAVATARTPPTSAANAENGLHPSLTRAIRHSIAGQQQGRKPLWPLCSLWCPLPLPSGALFRPRPRPPARRR